MISSKACRIAAALIAAAWTAGASASACYQVLDRNDTIIYRDRNPPWDMSTGDAGSRLKAAPPGERLMFFEADLCAPAALGRYAAATSDRSDGYFTGIREMGVGNRPNGSGVKSDRSAAPAAAASTPATGRAASAAGESAK